MKKLKILNGILATSLITVAVPISLASCDNAKNIDIKTNPNIDIECTEIKVGQELVMKYKLDDNYGFDLEKSTITFGDSNGVVTLLECEVDRANKTITVPAKYVTSTKVKIDIKAESSTTATVTETQYNEALDKLIKYTDTRAFTISGPGTYTQYDPSGKEISSFNMGMVMNADGYKDYICQLAEGFEQPVEENWGEKDSVVGAWQYAKSYEMEEIVKAPAPRSFASAFLGMMLVETFPGYKKMSYDSLYNAYYAKWSPEKGEEWAAALKFDSNHKLSAIAYTNSEEDSHSHLTNVGTIWLSVDYTKPTVTIPTQAKIRSEMMYENADEYTFKNNQLECPIHQDGLFGRFDIPISKLTNFDKTKDLTLHLDKNANVGGCEACVSINGAPISSTLYTFDDTKYVLTIKKEAYSALSSIQKLNIVLANPGFGGAGFKERPTKFIIGQEIEKKEVTLTPKQESFEALNISLANYNEQTITNKSGTTKASWTFATGVTIPTQQKYKFSVDTASGTIEKIITLETTSTAFEVEFTAAEWAKLTNGASITIDPDYIDKSCQITVDSSFSDHFDVLQINPNPVVEAGDRETSVYVKVNQKSGHQAGTASLVLKSDPTKVIATSDIPQEITTPYNFNFAFDAEKWLIIPYENNELEIHYAVNP